MKEYERKLLESARKGNIEAFETLAEGYYKRVYNILLKNLGKDANVSELTQEVFVRVFRNLRQVDGGSALAVSIYKSAREICRSVHSGVRLIS